MNNHSTKAKRRQLQRALDSIQIAEPPQRAKVQTESAQPYNQSQGIVLMRPSGKDDRGMRALRRLYRYKQGEEEEATLNKYKSLELAKRQLRRRSEHKLNHSLERHHPSLERSPYLPLNEKKLAPVNSRDGLIKVASKEGRKLSLPRKITLRSKDPLQKQSLAQLKEAGRVSMKSNDFSGALRLLERCEVSEGQSDLQLLDMTGVCLMNLRQFEEAVVRFSRVVLLDSNYSKKIYISLALCENQLNHAQRCLHYINQCISLFPDYYEAFYFKGKLLYKQELYQEAIDLLLQAAALNPHKQEIRMLVAECYFLQNNLDQALLYYQRYLGDVTPKNVKHAIRYANLLISHSRQQEGIVILQASLLAMQKIEEMDKERIQACSKLTLAYYQTKNYELCAMRGEEVLSRGNITLVLPVVKAMIACKILEHDYYGGIYFMRRLESTLLAKPEIRPFVEFLQGVAMLMKRRVEEGISKLKQMPQLLNEVGQDEFSVHIQRNFRLFVLYGLFLQGKYDECLKEVNQQREIGVQLCWEDSLGYVQRVCEAMISYNKQDYEQAEKQLIDCMAIYPQRVEVSLYLALLQLKLGFKNQGTEGEGIRAGIFHLLTICVDRFGASCSNYAAFIFYYRALLAAWEGEWAVAAAELELAIEKSQDNYFNFYYLRAIVVANLQNYKQAISDASLALSISEQPAAYLLRARCLQIDGNPGQAFADLQAFIALRPEDKQVHKFAGHLLFQNGAFEDALQAYGQGEVGNADLEVFLTRSKTYFLLGNFLRAAEDMEEAARLHPDHIELRFDQRVIQWLGQLFQRYIKNQNEDNYTFDPTILTDCLQSLRAIYRDGVQAEVKYGKIFKLPEFLTLTAVCQFYLGQYDEAIDSFIEAIELKQAALGSEQGEGEFEEEEAEKLVFINQMYYNLAICCCMTNDYPNAERYLHKCNISPDLHNYDTYLQLIDQITGRNPVEEDAQYLDLFSLRNKLSRYLPRVKVPFLCRTNEEVSYRPLKPCIPYPKVEPPEITPPFDAHLIEQIDLNDIQRRADAPWIFREKNSIKFTERIDVFSRFQLEKSEVEDKKGQMGGNPSDSSFDGVPLNLREEGIRERLRLDARLEERLNKLIGKEK